MDVNSPEIENYLLELDATGAVRDRISQYVRIYASFFPTVKFDRIFINDSYDEDGKRELGSLWFVGASHFGESKNFAATPHLSWDLAPLGQLKHLDVKSSDFSPSYRNSRARLQVTWANESGIRGVLRATGGNASHLSDITKQFLSPRAV